MIRFLARPVGLAFVMLGLVSGAFGQAVGGLQKLEIIDQTVGKGRPAEDGDTLYVTYVGKLLNGTIFDRNDAMAATPLAVVLGAGKVIKGWDVGLKGMKVGGKRTLKVPSALGYGAQANEKIPANSDLFFEITLLDIVKVGEDVVYDANDVKVGTGRAAQAKDVVTVHYEGRLVNKKLIDSSYKRGKTVTFTLGIGDAISGIDEGLKGMKVGGKRILRLPPRLCQGSAGTQFLPPNQVIIYTVEMIKIVPGKKG
ncbi:MAG: FKBP-type peptidyl-prolyl cis-trans isomerase [Armatimonadetes bacterium]|nr:FKBP-type peptidyl-prolyl cis-trans isomerase [Armatimonadota bacterium]